MLWHSFYTAVFFLDRTHELEPGQQIQRNYLALTDGWNNFWKLMIIAILWTQPSTFSCVSCKCWWPVLTWGFCSFHYATLCFSVTIFKINFCATERLLCILAFCSCAFKMSCFLKIFPEKPQLNCVLHGFVKYACHFLFLIALLNFPSHSIEDSIFFCSFSQIFCFSQK